MDTKNKIEHDVESVQPPKSAVSKAVMLKTAADPVKKSIAGEESKEAYRQSEDYRKAKAKLKRYGEVGQWFQTLCWVRIPIFGFFYMLVLAVRKKTPPQKKSFAIAYVLYRCLVMLLAFTILFVLYKVGLSFIDEILNYAGGL